MDQAKLIAGTLAIWLLPLLLLKEHWWTNPLYQYGLAAFPCALFLSVKRWESRPAARAAGKGFAPWLWGAGAFLLGAGWVVAQPSPDWRLVAWALVAGGSLATLSLFLASGGWAWARHFLFPFLFFAAATPWPTGLELFLIGHLTEGVAAITTALLNAAGIAAVRSGALIELGAGVLGVDEACSGIRSFQAALAGGLFLGEIYRLRPAHRLALIAGGAALAFAGNIARATLLAAAVSRSGLSALDAFHDPAGWLILSGTLGLLWVAAARFPPGDIRAAGSGALPGRPLFLWSAASLASVALIAGGTSLWYREGESKVRLAWLIDPGSLPPSAEPIPIRDAARQLLRYDEGFARAWSDGEGNRFALYAFRWYPGPLRSRMLARSHRPEICLPATGYRLVGEPAETPEFPGLFPARFTASAYEDPATGERLHVFYGIAEELRDAAPDNGPPGWSRAEGLRAVLSRKARAGQQVLQLILAGPVSGDSATEILRREMEALGGRSGDSGDSGEPGTIR